MSMDFDRYSQSYSRESNNFQTDATTGTPLEKTSLTAKDTLKAIGAMAGYALRGAGRGADYVLQVPTALIIGGGTVLAAGLGALAGGAFGGIKGAFLTRGVSDKDNIIMHDKRKPFIKKEAVIHAAAAGSAVVSAGALLGRGAIGVETALTYSFRSLGNILLGETDKFTDTKFDEAIVPGKTTLLKEGKDASKAAKEMRETTLTEAKAKQKEIAADFKVLRE